MSGEPKKAAQAASNAENAVARSNRNRPYISEKTMSEVYDTPWRGKSTARKAVNRRANRMQMLNVIDNVLNPTEKGYERAERNRERIEKARKSMLNNINKNWNNL